MNPSIEKQRLDDFQLSSIVVQKFKYCYMVLRSLNLPVIVIYFIFLYLRWCLRSTRFLSGSRLRAESRKNFLDQKRLPFSGYSQILFVDSKTCSYLLLFNNVCNATLPRRRRPVHIQTKTKAPHVGTMYIVGTTLFQFPIMFLLRYAVYKCITLIVTTYSHTGGYEIFCDGAKLPFLAVLKIVCLDCRKKLFQYLYCAYKHIYIKLFIIPSHLTFLKACPGVLSREKLKKNKYPHYALSTFKNIDDDNSMLYGH
ncbi:hypothetical protein AGLY_009529 [Aphis glycines]|uniref:Uncharacterized protein n=1 Tax=Aphis glycines TaxID=307491 RepID=A0A6G0TIB2_APHGL|nr:hypothetical protein AGLY_009529 [Aphis glycines]